MLDSVKEITIYIVKVVLITLAIYEWIRIIPRQIRRGWGEGKKDAEIGKVSWFKKKTDKKTRIWVIKLKDGRVAITGSEKEMKRFVSSHEEDGNLGDHAWNIPISEFETKII